MLEHRDQTNPACEKCCRRSCLVLLLECSLVNGRANIRSGDEPIKYPMMNSMAINLDMLGTFMKSRIVGKTCYSFVITIHGHAT